MKRKRQPRAPARARQSRGPARPAARRPAPRKPASRREPSETHQQSPTAVALEAERTGVLPAEPERQEIPGEDRVMRAGDPDVSALANEYSGEEMPGADMPTPDQSVVDEIGRAYGLEVGDADSLRPSSEILERRDRKRRRR